MIKNFLNRSNKIKYIFKSFVNFHAILIKYFMLVVKFNNFLISKLKKNRSPLHYKEVSKVSVNLIRESIAFSISARLGRGIADT